MIEAAVELEECAVEGEITREAVGKAIVILEVVGEGLVEEVGSGSNGGSEWGEEREEDLLAGKVVSSKIICWETNIFLFVQVETKISFVISRISKEDT